MRTTAVLKYPRPMAKLLACRFCRTMFAASEGVTACPECGVVLEPLENLPPSEEVLAEDDLDATPPEDRLLPAAYFRRGRGLLPLLCLASVGLFFLPWIVVTTPETMTLSGYDIALRNRIFWGGFIGALMTIPLTLTRRSVRQLAGIRIITAFFAVLPLVEGTIVLVNPPYQDTGIVPWSFTYGAALFASMAVSLGATIVAAGLGGSTTDYRDLPLDAPDVGRRERTEEARRRRHQRPAAAAPEPDGGDRQAPDEKPPGGVTLH